MPKSTLSRLSFKDYPLRKRHVIVKAFDGSRKSVFGEVDLSITIGPQKFKITFQLMDIPSQYSCLLGRPWIHEAGAITSTLHQKLKFIKNDKLITVCGERALIVSNLSSFSDIEPKEVVGTKFQALSLDKEKGKEKAASISSYKDAIQVVKDGTTSGWGHIDIPTNNKNGTGVGFFPTSSKAITGIEVVLPIQETSHSGGFLQPVQQTVNTIGTEDPDENFEVECMSYLLEAGYIALSESDSPCCYPTKGSESKTQPRSDEVTNNFTTRSHGSSEEVPPIPKETWDI